MDSDIVTINLSVTGHHHVCKRSNLSLGHHIMLCGIIQTMVMSSMLTHRQDLEMLMMVITFSLMDVIQSVENGLLVISTH